MGFLDIPGFALGPGLRRVSEGEFVPSRDRNEYPYDPTGGFALLPNSELPEMRHEIYQPFKLLQRRAAHLEKAVVTVPDGWSDRIGEYDLIAGSRRPCPRALNGQDWQCRLLQGSEQILKPEQSLKWLEDAKAVIQDIWDYTPRERTRDITYFRGLEPLMTKGRPSKEVFRMSVIEWRKRLSGWTCYRPLANPVALRKTDRPHRPLPEGVEIRDSLVDPICRHYS